MRHARYLRYVLRHKWFVLVAGLRTGAPIWRLVIHDWTKFTPAEWTPYVNRFFSGSAGKEDKSADPDEFHRAWTHHWHRNAHHWEHWLRADGEPMEMPEALVREMVADWMGAGRAITGRWEVCEWYAQTKAKQRIHPRTRVLVEWLLEVHG
jgi:hypothetical protein